jgi:hypothetical protein
MTTEHRTDATRKPAAKKTASRRPATERSGHTTKEKKMTLTTNAPVTTGLSTTTTADDKGFLDFLSGIVPTVAQTAASAIGIDPRVAGQTVSQVLGLFGIGGPDKAFTPAVPRDQSVAQLKQIVSPYLNDPAFSTALQKWVQAAVEPVQAHKDGKAYTPSVDLSKSWFDDAISSIGDAVSSVNWGQVAQVGMQALPFVMAAL